MLSICLLTACANLQDAQKNSRGLEGIFNGEHATLSVCVNNKLRSDGRTVLRPLQFKNRQYPDMNASEIHAYDTRYLHNAIATYAPSNPDAVLFYADSGTEILSSAQRSENDKPTHAFALLLQKIDEKTVRAILRGDLFTGGIAWKILQSCQILP